MSDVLEGLSKRIENHSFVAESKQLGYEKAQIADNMLNSNYIYPRLQEFFKSNDIVIAETGLIPNGIAKIKFPQNVELHSQTLWGSIGWATPATLGACIANPNSRVILITGEGSHQLTAMEIGNMLRRGVKPIIIVINNNGYTIERLLSDSPDDEFNEIMQMNYSKFARVFEGDIWSTRVSTADDFDKALKVTQIMNKLCYIEVCVDKNDVPELSKEVIGELKKNAQTKEISIPEQYCEKTEPIKLTKSEDMNFGTTVHESLRETDDE
jgi:indolepyruvate decarboxylase